MFTLANFTQHFFISVQFSWNTPLAVTNCKQDIRENTHACWRNLRAEQEHNKELQKLDCGNERN